jgi:hypothetical protein
MKLSEIKGILKSVDAIVFQLPNKKSFVPEHFHITEVGLITKNFIDCGGTVREEKVINFQLWEAADYNHRLSPTKLLRIIEKSEEIFKFDDFEIEIEYQSDTIGKFGLTYNGIFFQLTNKQTACLAQDACGIPIKQQKIKLKEMEQEQESCCSPKGNCC